MRKILLADDNSLILDRQKSFLEIRDFEILVTTSAKEIQDLATENRPHLIIVDFEMEELDGAEICRRLKRSEATKKIPVVINCRRDPEDIKLECMLAGADRVIRRAEGRDFLLRQIVEVLGITPRQAQRVSCDLRIGVDASGEQAVGIVQNISQSGLYLTLRKVIQGGSGLRLTFRLPASADTIDILGEVVRIESLVGGHYGYGIQFLEAKPAALEALKRFSKRHESS